MRRVEVLQAALDSAQATDVCAQHGCRLARDVATAHEVEQPDHGTAVAPWRDPEWEHPLVRRLRTKVSEQANALDRLRLENGLLRRWVSRNLGQETPGKGA